MKTYITIITDIIYLLDYVFQRESSANAAQMAISAATPVTGSLQMFSARLHGLLTSLTDRTSKIISPPNLGSHSKVIF